MAILHPSAPMAPLHRILLGCAIILMAIINIRQLQDADIGFHLKAGESILSRHEWPCTDDFTYTLKDHSYVDTSWGYQVLSALIYRTAGAPGIVLFSVVLLELILLLLYFSSRLKTTISSWLLLLLFAFILCSEYRFSPRPEFFSYFCIALLIYFMRRYLYGAPIRLIYIPFIFLVWANFHSFFVFGLVILIIFLVSSSILKRKVDYCLLLTFTASFAATLANPYQLKAYYYFFSLSAAFRHTSAFKHSIGEFISPLSTAFFDYFPLFPSWIIFSFRFLALVSPFIIYWQWKQKRYENVLLWLVFLPLAASMLRNIPLFYSIILPGLAEMGHHLYVLLTMKLHHRVFLIARHVFAATLLIVFTLASLTIFHDGYYIVSGRDTRFGIHWNSIALPVEAADFFRKKQLPAPLLNHLNHGGYLMMALSQPVFIDGRLEVCGEAFYSYFQRIFSDQLMLEEAIHRYNIRSIILPYQNYPDFARYLHHHHGWTLVYLDHIAAIYISHDDALAMKLPPFEADLATVPETPMRLLPGLWGNPRTTKWSFFLDSLISKCSFPYKEYNLGFYFSYVEDYSKGIRYFSHAIRRSGGMLPDMYFVLGELHYRQGKLEEASQCYHAVLDVLPSFEPAKGRLMEISIRRR